MSDATECDICGAAAGTVRVNVVAGQRAPCAGCIYPYRLMAMGDIERVVMRDENGAETEQIKEKPFNMVDSMMEWFQRERERLQQIEAMTLDELRNEHRVLMRQVDHISVRIRRLELEESRADHPCSCVRLNSDIDVNDMGAAGAMRRQLFGLGLVAELLSADIDCFECEGTGVPKEEA